MQELNVICQSDRKNKCAGLYLIKDKKQKKQMEFGLGR